MVRDSNLGHIFCYRPLADVPYLRVWTIYAATTAGLMHLKPLVVFVIDPDETAGMAVGETVILLHPPPPAVGITIAMERERQQNDSPANGQAGMPLARQLGAWPGTPIPGQQLLLPPR